MRTIKTSVFELFKIGPGPSSSHTIAPMKAGYDFLQNVKALSESEKKNAHSIEVRLFGSLSATGKGHWTDRGVLAGLLGQKPETCPHDFLDGLLAEPDETYDADIGGKKIQLKSENIIFDEIRTEYRHINTMVIKLLGGGQTIFEREYYSVGGGFLKWKGSEDPKAGEPLYKYENITQLKKLLGKHGLKLHELMIENEKAITGKSEKEIYAGLKNVVRVMEEAVENGVKAEGLLPGTIGLHRKAHTLYAQSQKMQSDHDRFFAAMSAYAMAVAEESAAGRRVATAPTCGSSGVIPGVLIVMKRRMGIKDEDIYNGLLAAAAVGFICKNNASLAGAEVGCQGEIGVASCMAAAMLAYASGYSFRVTENAAETAMEHHLGLTCDPVGGYVQIPCIERNAMGAVKAYTAYLIATGEDALHHMVDFDKVIMAMAETGRDM
ncbi:MAG: L-serine ammonia-lyase, partial [Nitrospinota bacterium]